MAMVNFKKGLLANLANSPIAEGTFHVTTDERAIYLDVDGSTRIRLGDFIEVANTDALPTAGANANALYYVTDINCLAKWNGTEWIQINRDTGATSIEVVGSGNAVTAASYDAVTRKLTLTMGETFVKKSEVGSLAGKSEVAEADLNAALAKKINDASAANHAHSNKDELDKIAEGDKAKWDAELGSAAAIAAMKDGAAIDSFKDVEDALAGKQATGDYATKAEAQGYADAKDDAINAAKKAGDDAQGDVDALEGKVGAVPDGKTVVQMISDAQTAATYDDTEVRGLIGDNADAIGVLNGDETQAGSVKKTVSDEIAKVIAGAPESFDTLKEVSDWIATHGQDAASMNTAILALEAIVDGIGGEGEKATVVAYVTDAIAALKIGDYAKAADLTALAERVTTLEGATHTHANKVVLDGVTTEKVTAWDAAEKNAKDHADGLNTAMDARVKVVEGKAHTHANAAELDLIEAGDKAKWDAAETNAKTYADSLMTWGSF